MVSRMHTSYRINPDYVKKMRVSYNSGYCVSI